jgi:hypothetical protein
LSGPSRHEPEEAAQMRWIRRSGWRIGFWAAVAAALAVAGAPPARAGVQAFTGQLELQIAALDAIAISGSGFAFVEARPDDPNHLATMRLEASPFGVTGLVVPVTDPIAMPIQGVVATAHNGAGGFAENGGSLGGILPVFGVAKVCLFGACDADPAANLSVPITVVGQGGSAVASGPVNLTVVGAPWTTGTVSIGSLTAKGFARGPQGQTSSTLQPSGSIRLVTPIFISTNLGASAVVPAFGFLTLHFVPEPGTLVLVGGGLALLLRAGARRR